MGASVSKAYIVHRVLLVPGRHTPITITGLGQEQEVQEVVVHQPGQDRRVACNRYKQTCRRCLPGQRVQQGGEAGEEVTGQPHHLQRWVVRQRHRQRAQVVVAHVWGAGDCIYPETTLKSYLQSPGLGCSKTCWVANF